jgi:hypothetical protein
MGRRKKPEFVTSHTRDLLVNLRGRAGLSVRDVAAATGYSRQAIHVAEVRTRDASMDVIMAFARACGASRAELDRLPALVAMDKGRLEVPRGVTEEQVVRAREVLGNG